MSHQRCDSFSTILNKWSSLIRWRSHINLSKNARGKTPTVALIHGQFHGLNYHYIEKLKQASSYCDKLMVAVNDSYFLNDATVFMIESVRYVDKAHFFDDKDCCRLLRIVKPEVYMNLGSIISEQEKVILHELKTKVLPKKDYV